MFQRKWGKHSLQHDSAKLWRLNRWQLLLIEQRIVEVEAVIAEMSGEINPEQPWWAKVVSQDQSNTALFSNNFKHDGAWSQRSDIT